MKLEELSKTWMLKLEQRKAQLPYSFVWCLFGLGASIILFGFLNRVWPYYLEGTAVVGLGVTLFIFEMCWRRIVELKAFLSEYRNAERNAGIQASEPAVETVLPAEESNMDLADREEESAARGELVEFELLP